MSSMRSPRDSSWRGASKKDRARVMLRGQWDISTRVKRARRRTHKSIDADALRQFLFSVLARIPYTGDEISFSLGPFL